VLIFAAEAPEHFSRQAASFLSDPENVLEVSAVSVAEIAVKATLGKLLLSPDAMHDTLQDIGARLLSFSANHAFQMFGLPLHHRDPFDRQIIAQALAEQIPVVTPDHHFRAYPGLRVLW